MKESRNQTEKIPVCLLVRVSTRQQETQRQISELKEHADKNNYHIIEICEETISGASTESERTGLQRALELARTGQIKKVLVHEVSRIARRNSTAHKFLETLHEYGVSLYWHTQGIETLLDSGKLNPSASIMFALLAEMARNERETMVERIRSGQAEARRQGKHLGRPKGSKTSPADYLKKHEDVVRTLKRGLSIRHTSKICGKGISTVQKVRHLLPELSLSPSPIESH